MGREANLRPEKQDTRLVSAGRREFLKSVAAVGAGVSASPFLYRAGEAQSRIHGPNAAVAAAGGLQETSSILGQLGAPKFVVLAMQNSEPVDWHGFMRYDFILDEETLNVVPFQAPRNEGAGVGAPDKGKRRCVLVKPLQAAGGKPWSWRGCYWDHQPQAEVELLKRGFHIAYISADVNLRPGKEWDAWYAYLTGTLGLSAKPAFVGMSRGGEFAYTWATRNPDKVSCIYADNPGMNPEAWMGLWKLADNEVPLFHVCGSIDPLLGTNLSAIEEIYRQFGGEISVMIKEGFGHHPHSLHDPRPIADFIERSVNRPSVPAPAFMEGASFVKSFYYSSASDYRNFPTEGTFLTCRGPVFLGAYSRYAFNVKGTEGSTTVIVPSTPAPETPWVFRAGFVGRETNVDVLLLQRGFHIVTGPVGYNFDGPVQQHWDAVYSQLVRYGFSKKPVLEGSGGGAGEVYAWAIANSGKVACIYAENPILHSHMAIEYPLEHLASLAGAQVPIIHACGSLDPGYENNSHALEEAYRRLGGNIEVRLRQGGGHYPLVPEDPVAVVEFIAKAVLKSQ